MDMVTFNSETEKIYTPFYANIDLFFGGILIDRIARVKFKNQNCVLLKDLSIFALLSLVCLLQRGLIAHRAHIEG